MHARPGRRPQGSRLLFVPGPKSFTLFTFVFLVLCTIGTWVIDPQTWRKRNMRVQHHGGDHELLSEGELGRHKGLSAEGAETNFTDHRHPQIVDVPASPVVEGEQERAKTGSGLSTFEWSVREGSMDFTDYRRPQIADVHAPVKLRMWVANPKQCIMSDALFNSHMWEENLIGAIIRVMETLGGEEVFLDIGANIGSYSIAVSSQGIRTVAIEAMDWNARLLQASFSQFGPAHPKFDGDKVTIFKAAVSDKPGGTVCIVPVVNPRRNVGNGQMQPNAVGCPVQKGGTAEIVNVTTVDTLIAGKADVANRCFGALKIDIEGFEMTALRGAKKLLEGACPPCWLQFEYKGSRPGQPNPIFQYLVEKLDYTCVLGFVPTSKDLENPAKASNFVSRGTSFDDSKHGDYVCLGNEKVHERCASVRRLFEKADFNVNVYGNLSRALQR